MTPVFNADQLAAFKEIVSIAKPAAIRTFVVGGVVRDLLLNGPALDKDVDILVEADAIEFGRKLAESVGGDLKIFPSFCTAKLVRPRQFPTLDEIDLASARTESYRVPGALPTVSLSTVEQDLRRRDFTINAMAVPLEGLLEAYSGATVRREVLDANLLDYFGGRTDLQHKLIRILHDNSFVDDPTRLYRAARYAVRLGGALQPQTEKLLQHALQARVLDSVSEQRKFNELKKVLSEQDWGSVLALLEGWGVLAGSRFLAGPSRHTVLQALRLIGQRAPRLESTLLPGILVALAAVCLGGEESRFSDLGLSKKKLAELAGASAIVGRDASSDLTKISDETLMAVVLVSDHRGCLEELARRGLGWRM